MPASYLICATPRTGSTLLCDLLAATGVTGAPDSFFMRDIDPLRARQWGLPDHRDPLDRDSVAAYLAAAIRAGSGRTGVFGLRLMRENLDDLSAMIGMVHPGLPSDKARLRAAFGDILFIHLTRNDKLAQAVSMVMAEQTGLWHLAPDGTELERLAPPQPPQYDYARIAAKRAGLRRDDAAWRDWFRDQGIAPLHVEYRTLAARPAATVARICSALGVAAPATATLRPGVARMPDTLKRDWMRRYRDDARSRRRTPRP